MQPKIRALIYKSVIPQWNTYTGLQNSFSKSLCKVFIHIGVSVSGFYSRDKHFNLDTIMKYMFTTITSKFVFVPQVSLPSKNSF